MTNTLLVDANAIAARIFYAGGDPRDAPDVMATVIPGPFDRTVWCFDGERPYWRQTIHAAYKATRTAHPEAWAGGLARLRERVGGLSQAGYEADDIIATLVYSCVERVVIATTDKDLLQLHSRSVEVWRPNGIAWDRDDPSTSLGVPSELVCDYLALVGDSTDNIPGVPGIGKTKAKVLLARYGSLENGISAGAVEQRFVDAARLSRRLVELRTDAKLP